MWNRLKKWAKQLKLLIYVLFLSYKDPRVSWYAKIFTAVVVAYAFSPIDLIPDFIPILWYLDDVIIVPLGIMFALKMIPEEVVQGYRQKAEEIMKKGKPKNWFLGIIIVLVWILFIGWIFIITYRYLFNEGDR